MWKWTESKNIKVIILDTDSLKQEFLDFKYDECIHDIQLYFVKHMTNKNSHNANIIPYIDISSLLQEILKLSKCESTSIISISNNPLFLKEMMQNHIGTILTNDFDKNFLKSITDFSIHTTKQLTSILIN